MRVRGLLCARLHFNACNLVQSRCKQIGAKLIFPPTRHKPSHRLVAAAYRTPTLQYNTTRLKLLEYSSVVACGVNTQLVGSADRRLRALECRQNGCSAH
jgi:hypothetical protein